MAESYGLTRRWAELRPAVQLLVLVGLLAATFALVVYLLEPSSEPRRNTGVTTEQYNRWRAECEAVATAELDWSRYEVGGRQWTSDVNACLLAKATD